MRSGRDAWKLSRKMSFNQDNREDNREETQGGGGAVKKISHAKTQRRKGRPLASEGVFLGAFASLRERAT